VYQARYLLCCRLNKQISVKLTGDSLLVYKVGDLVPTRNTDSDFHANKAERKSTCGYVFTFFGITISWRSIKQSCIANSTMEAEYVAALKAY
jgi:hypothetical protein